jgi:glycosyltransferase involved in cell wall biosynthesis
MQLGRPVVATTGCGFEEVIEDGISGFLVAPGDAVALAGQILAALTKPAELERVGAGGLRRVGDFSIDVMAERLVSYYAQLVGRRRGVRAALEEISPRSPLPSGASVFEQTTGASR